VQRRTFTTATATAAVALLALTACSGGGASNSDALKAKGDITIWYSNNEQEVAWGKAMVEAWNKDHPEEQVKGQ
jgi:multiple sugar transport system substrate-binding protein